LKFQQHKTYVKYLNFKLYYQLLHLTYLCNLARYWLRAPWGWHNSVETCRRSVIICEIIVHLLVIVQNNKRRTVQRIKIKKNEWKYVRRPHTPLWPGEGFTIYFYSEPKNWSILRRSAILAGKYLPISTETVYRLTRYNIAEDLIFY